MALDFLSDPQVHNEIVLFGAKLKVQAFAVDGSGNPVGLPVLEKSIAVYRLIDDVDAEPDDAAITLPATRRGERTGVEFRYAMPVDLKPTLRYTHANDSGQVTDTTDLVIEALGNTGITQIALTPPQPTSNRDDGFRSGLANYQVVLSPAGGGASFAAFTVNAFVVRPTQISLSLADFTAGIRDELLRNLPGGLTVTFEDFLADNPDYRESPRAEQVEAFAGVLYSAFLTELGDIADLLDVKIRNLEPGPENENVDLIT
ncbi:hypothetical protein WDZ92_47750, partial [Nostoc sp. NIES-2111]